MVSKKVRKIIDAAIKDVWLSEIRDDYIDGKLIWEASLQCSLYYHSRNIKIHHSYSRTGMG